MEGCIADSVTRCWSYKVAQILPKIVQILATAFLHQLIFFKFSQKSPISFGLLLLANLLPKNFQKSPNLVTLFIYQCRNNPSWDNDH